MSIQAITVLALPLLLTGTVTANRFVTATVGQNFAFPVCVQCTLRMERLPVRLQGRQMDIAVSNLERHPERYEIHFFESGEAARLYVRLEDECLSANFFKMKK